MQQPTLNGVVKPADTIAKGPHVFNENTRKYVELPQQAFAEFPRVMYHETEDAKCANGKEEQVQMEAAGWRTKAFPPKVVAKETVTAAPADLALIVLQQQQELKAMSEQLAKLTNSAAATDEPKRTTKASKPE